MKNKFVAIIAFILYFNIHNLWCNSFNFFISFNKNQNNFVAVYFDLFVHFCACIVINIFIVLQTTWLYV